MQIFSNFYENVNNKNKIKKDLNDGILNFDP